MKARNLKPVINGPRELNDLLGDYLAARFSMQQAQETSRIRAGKMHLSKNEGYIKGKRGKYTYLQWEQEANRLQVVLVKALGGELVAAEESKHVSSFPQIEEAA